MDAPLSRLAGDLVTALATTPLTDEDLAWLRQYFIDTYNEDWATKYQLELVGEVPDDVLLWAHVERRVVCASCGHVSDGQYFVSVIEDDGSKRGPFCEDCADEVLP